MCVRSYKEEKKLRSARINLLILRDVSNNINIAIYSIEFSYNSN